ncbi:MAG: hypothetical protein CBE36_00395 [Oceanospirillaceae bacterium TMED276]|nr:MAG: hypothetical protein CBE36_00395 [Oceanospirillaceae bacterium TMED276]
MKVKVGYLIILGGLVFLGLAGSGHLSSPDSVLLVSNGASDAPDFADLLLKGGAVLVVGVALLVVLNALRDREGGDQ